MRDGARVKPGLVLQRLIVIDRKGQKPKTTFSGVILFMVDLL